MAKRRVLLSWSSGKDSAWCLHALNQRPAIDVVGLVTTFNNAADRVAMHAVRRELVQMQAHSIGLPLRPVELPWPCPNAAYEQAMRAGLDEAYKELRFDAVAFGDLFLEDIRTYREQQLVSWGHEPMFPLWQLDTDTLAQAMIAAGQKAILTCVDPKQCPAELVGREFDQSLLNDLPDSVDPCGENGEFHTFVFDGPIFDRPIAVSVGETVERDGFIFADIEPSPRR